MFSKVELKAILLFSLALQACSNSNPAVMGSCVSTVSVKEQLNFELSEIQSIGGYIEIDYGSTKPPHKDSSIEKCSVFVEFDRDEEDEGFYPVTLWSAKHCVAEAYAQSMSLHFQMRSDTSATNLVGQTKVYRGKERFQVDILSKFRALKENDPVGYGAFARYYDTYKVMDPRRIFEVRQWALETADASGNGKPLLANDKAHFPDFEIYESYKREIESQKAEHLKQMQAKLGSLPEDFEAKPLCFYRDVNEENKDTNQKICFLHGDLAAYKAKLAADSFTDSLAKLQKDKMLTARTSNPHLSEWARNNSGSGMRAVGIGQEWKDYFREEPNVIALGAAGRCARDRNTSCPDISKVTRIFLGAAAPVNSEFALVHHLEAVLKRIRLWKQLTSEILKEVSTADLLMHTNLKKARSTGAQLAVYEEIPMSKVYSLSDKDRLRNISDGFVLDNKQNNFSFYKTDSGTIVTVAGIIPLVALSTVDNEDASGGPPARIPERGDEMPEDTILADDMSDYPSISADNDGTPGSVMNAGEAGGSEDQANGDPLSGEVNEDSMTTRTGPYGSTSGNEDDLKAGGSDRQDPSTANNGQAGSGC